MNEFQWSRASAAAGISIYWIASGIAGPFIGRFIDRYGPKWVMMVGTLMSGLSLAMLSFTNSLVHFQCFYALLAFSHCATATVPYGVLISRWFIKKRGKAMGIATTGVSLGGFVLVPLTEFLIQGYGWRVSYIILGGLVVCVFTPIVAFVVKASPGEVGCLPDGLPLEEALRPPPPPGVPPGQTGGLSSSAWTLADILQTRTFWLMSTTLFCTYMVMFGVLTHQIPFILDMGLASSTAAAALSFTALMGIMGKLAIGFMADRFSVKFATIFTLGLQLISVLVLMATKSTASLWIYVILFGIAMGGATLRPLLPTWLFGLSALGILQGITQMSMALGSSIGPFMAGYLYDIFDNYHLAFMIFAILCAVGLLAIHLAHPAVHRRKAKD